MSVPTATPQSRGDFDQRLAAIERITQLFKLERIVYLSITILALGMLLASAGILVWKGTAGPAELSSLFGSSGLIAYSCGRVLFMWHRALSFLLTQGDSTDE
jgi:hypothetical protein